VVHLIYKRKNFETSSKDYDFSRFAMQEHWNAGERDVDRLMQHPEWLSRPQNGETMVTYDLTREDLSWISTWTPVLRAA
jgi:NTE family protein